MAHVINSQDVGQKRDVNVNDKAEKADHDFVHKVKSQVKSLSRVQLFVTPWTVAYQSSQSMQFSRNSTGAGCHSPEDLPNPGTEPGSPTLQADALPSEPPGKPNKVKT